MNKLDKIFEQINSEILTDDVKLQMEVLFESAVNEAIEAEKAKLEEEAKEKLQLFEDKVLTAIDDYLNEYLDKFVKENTPVLEDAIKVKKAEEILKTFHNITEQFYLEINKNASDETIKENEELEKIKEEYNKVINEKIELEKTIKEMKKEKLINEKAEELKVESMKERFKELAKSLEYTTESEFEEKLKVLKESLIQKNEEKKEDEKKDNVEKLTEDIEEKETKSTTRNNSLAEYLRYF